MIPFKLPWISSSITSLRFKTKVCSEVVKSDSTVKLFAMMFNKVGRSGGMYLMPLMVHCIATKRFNMQRKIRTYLDTPSSVDCLGEIESDGAISWSAASRNRQSNGLQSV